MDDKRFDDIIRGKVGEFQEQDFDPSGLADLHHRMAGVYTVPWYSLWRSEILMASGMIIMTTILLSSQWYTRQNNSDDFQTHAGMIDNQNREIRELKNELAYLSSMVPDTVRQTEIRYYERPAVRTASQLPSTSSFEKLSDHVIYLGAEDVIPPDVRVILKESGLFASVDGNAYLILNQEDIRIVKSRSEYPEFGLKDRELVFPGMGVGVDKRKNKALITLDRKTAMELEKHYHKGIGVKMGLSGGITANDYQGGSSKPTLLLGTHGEFVLSPILSSEIGIEYGVRHVTIKNAAELAKYKLENSIVDDLEKLENETKFLEVPFNFKLRRMYDSKTHFIVGTGVSSFLSWKQEVEYTLDNAGSTNESAKLVQDNSVNKIDFTPASINILGGIQRELENGRQFETTIQYQFGFNQVGSENPKADFIGIKAKYWFTIR